MKIQTILSELKKEGWVFDEEFIINNEDMLQAISNKTLALQLQQTGVVRSNLIDESPEPIINVNRFNENDYHDGKFLK
jgi:hypothetical protein